MQWDVDVLVIQESKSVGSLAIVNFLIDGISTPYPSHRDSEGGKVMLFISKYNLSNRVAIKNKSMEDFMKNSNFEMIKFQ